MKQPNVFSIATAFVLYSNLCLCAGILIRFFLIKSQFLIWLLIAMASGLVCCKFESC